MYCKRKKRKREVSVVDPSFIKVVGGSTCGEWERSEGGKNVWETLLLLKWVVEGSTCSAKERSEREKKVSSRGCTNKHFTITKYFYNIYIYIYTCTHIHSTHLHTYIHIQIYNYSNKLSKRKRKGEIHPRLTQCGIIP